MKLRSEDVTAWLSARRSEPGTYRHLHLTENEAAGIDGASALAEIVEQAHADQLDHFDELLAPLDPDGRATPGADLTRLGLLPMNALKGYLGEILAAVVAENFRPHGIEWTVPAFTFRFDQDAETWMVQALQGESSTPVFGRHGHDCIAFARGNDGELAAYLVCEGKCTAGHKKSLIDAGHSQLSGEGATPADVLRLIKILGSDSGGWAESLQRWLLSRREGQDLERFDLLMYVCGRGPEPPRTTWMSTTTANSRYEGGRRLEAAEAHLAGVNALIRTLYGKAGKSA